MGQVIPSRLERCARLAETRGRRLAIALVGTPDDAEDVIQQALLVAARKADAIPLFSLWPWLARVIAFEAKNLRRMKQRHAATPLGHAADRHGGQFPPEPAAPTGDDPMAIAIAAEMRSQLTAAMAGLDETQRDALALVYGGGLSVREAARVLGVPKTTLQRSVNAAVDNLRGKLGVSKRAAIGAMSGFWTGLAGGLASGAAGSAAGGAGSASGGGTGFSGAGAGGTGGGIAAAKTAAGAIAVGGLLMTTKQILAVGAIIAVASAGVWWGLSGGDEADGRRVGDTGQNAPQEAPVSGARPSDVIPPAPDAPRADVTPAVEAHDSTQNVKPTDQRVWKAFKLPISGHVTGEQWKRIAGARVLVGSGVSFDRAAAISALPETPAGGPYRGVVAPLVTEFPDCRIEANEGVTDGEGKFSLEFRGERLVPADAEGDAVLPDSIRMMAVKEGFLSIPDEPRNLKGWGTPIVLDSVSLRLNRSRDIRGKVLWLHDRSPVAGATVEVLTGTAAMEMSGQRSGFPEPAWFPRMVTNAAGEFEVRGLPGLQSGRVTAAPPGMSIDEYKAFDTHLANVPVRLNTHDHPLNNDAEDLLLYLPKLSELRFRLSPVPEAPPLVMLHPYRDDWHQRSVGEVSAAMDPQGACTIQGLHSGHNRMMLRANGYEAVDLPLAPRPGENLDLGVIVLHRGTTMTGRVTDLAGNPVSGAKVEARPLPPPNDDASSRSAAPTSALSDEHGEYRLSGIGSGERMIRVSKTGLAAQLKQMAFQKDEVRSQDFSLGAGGTVSGKVRLDTPKSNNRYSGGGPAMPNLHVALVPMDPAGKYRNHEFELIRRWSEEWFAELMPDGPGYKDWQYTIGGVPAGLYSARLRVGDGDDWENPKCRHDNVLVKEGETTTVDFDKRVGESEGGTIRGRVLGWDGKPFASGTVSIGGTQKYVKLDAEGNYVFTGVKAGRAHVALHVRLPGADAKSISDPFGTVSRRVEVKPGEETRLDIDLSQDPGVLLVLRATLDGRTAFHGVSSMDEGSGGGRSISGAVSTEGELLLFYSEPGTKRVLLSAMVEETLVSAYVHVEVPNVRRFEHSIALETGTIVGRVSPPAGASPDFSLTGVFIDHAAVGGNPMSRRPGSRSVSCAADGTFRTTVIGPKFIVRAWTKGYSEVRKTIDVRGETHVDLQLGPPTGGIEVTCTAAEGERKNLKTDFWRVHLRGADPADRGFGTVVSEDRNAASIGDVTRATDLPPGDYEIRLVAANFTTFELTGPTVRQEDCEPDPLWAPDGKRWIVTITSGETLKLDVAMTAR